MSKKENKKDLSPYIAAICDRFDPAEEMGGATHMLSTKEIAEAINDLDPEVDATVSETCNALYEAGFVFQSPRGTAGINFKWLMREK